MELNEEAFDALARLVSFDPGDARGVDFAGIIGANSNLFINSAQSGGLAPLCYSRVVNGQTGMESIPGIVDVLKKNYLATLVQNHHRLALYREIERLLRDSGIPVVLLKGMALAFTVYGDEGLRPMGDLDLLVPPGQAIKARDILTGAGARAAHVPMSAWHELNHAHVRPLEWAPRGGLIEIHSKLFSTGSRYQPPGWRWEKLVRLRETVNGNFLVLNEAYMLYHLASHLLQAYKMGSMRLGWMIDIAACLDSSHDAKSIVEEAIMINPRIKGELLMVLSWVNRFNSQKVKQQLAGYNFSDQGFPGIEWFSAGDKVKKLHRGIVAREIVNTPGILNKLTALFFQAFPSREHMQWYHGAGKDGWLRWPYLKRIANMLTGKGIGKP